MRKPLFVKNLVINLLPNTFENVAQVYRFATCLMNVTVLGTFQLTGFDYQLCHLDLSLAAFASSLMMNCQPVQAFFKPCDMVTKVPGTFKNVYVPAQTLADVDPKQGQQIEDSAWMFAEYCMTDEGMDHYQW